MKEKLFLLKKIIPKKTWFKKIKRLFSPSYIRSTSAELEDIFHAMYSKKTFCERNAKNIETLYLGSSHIEYAFDSNLFDNSICNLGSNSQDLYNTLQLYKHFSSKLPKLKNIVVSISVFSPGYYLAKTERKFITDAFIYLYDFSYDKYIPEYKTILACNFFEKKFYKQRLTIPSPPAIKDNNPAHERAKPHLRENQRPISQLPFLQTLLSNAEQNGHKVYLVIMPPTQSYENALPSNDILFSKIYPLADSVHKLIDFYGSSQFSNDDFYDYHHLNPIGRKKFSQLLNDKIND